MRSLFLKVFTIFWIAQSLIFIISTALIVRHHFEGPEATFDALASSMRANASIAVHSYERGGCDALQWYATNIEQDIALKDASGHVLCGATGFGGVENDPESFAHVSGMQVGNRFITHLPVLSQSGKQYSFLLSKAHTPRKVSLYDDLLAFSFPQLPVAIVIDGFTTFALVLLFTRPVGLLRKATRDLAAGKLEVRIKTSSPQSRSFSGDAFSALTHDFNHMAERLQSLVDAQKLLLRDVSHELRSPLSRVSVALELAREDADPSMTAHLNRIERETEKLNLLIGQLLTLSSMEAIEKRETFKPLSLNHLIERMVPDAEFEAHQSQCSVVFHANADCAVLGSEELLYRAIENAVRNAIRYTATGTEVEIVLTAAKTPGTHEAIIDISDRGPGIPEDQRDAIFRPFHRVDYARSADTGGFGVGLAIAERAVRIHHGEMHALAREGGGTTIRITLPAVEFEEHGSIASDVFWPA
jgi:two-component system sensor histidine kinase CpxA